MQFAKNRIPITICLLLLSGCATLPDNIERSESFALPDAGITRLGDIFNPAIEQNPGKSGFHILNDGREAFVARAGLAAFAERSIDAQYYLWNDDRTGKYLLNELVKAAERGVRVRLLIDDTYAISKNFEIAALDKLTNMEVRLFNPYAERRKYAVFRRGINFITDLSRLNHRMHNKIFAVDGKVAIVGGRNIGDEYFGISEKYNFRDLDLISTGPIVSEVLSGFDQYWNSSWAWPASALTNRSISPEQTDELVTKLTRATDQYAGLKQVLPASESEYLHRLNIFKNQLIWATSELLLDSPTKGHQDSTDNPSLVLTRLAEITRESNTEILAESAYFVPGKRGAQALVDAVGRGLNVKVLTNSLASTNHAIAHTGYKPYRKQMLKGGVQLFEVNSQAKTRSQFTIDPDAKHNFGLHTKAIVFDRKKVFVGTLNLDPRSVVLNTEMGLLVDSEVLAGRIAALFDIDMHPENSFEVYLDNNKLRWKSELDGKPVVHRSEPGARFGRKLSVFFGSLFPIEKQL